MTSLLPATPRSARRGRRVLIAQRLLFFGSMFVAGTLRFVGWPPAVTGELGERLLSPADPRVPPSQWAAGDGDAWQLWQRLWRIVWAWPSLCVHVCRALVHDLGKVWRWLGYKAVEVLLLWIGTSLAGLLALPQLWVLRDDSRLRRGWPCVNDAGGVPVYMIDPNGFVIPHSVPGLDSGGWREDLAKLLKLM